MARIVSPCWYRVRTFWFLTACGVRSLRNPRPAQPAPHGLFRHAEPGPTSHAGSALAKVEAAQLVDATDRRWRTGFLGSGPLGIGCHHGRGRRSVPGGQGDTGLTCRFPGLRQVRGR
jgi:hypothetical protein